MAAINDLIAQIGDESLRLRIEAEVKRLLKHKKFGLVFEDHLPEGLTEGPIYPTLQVIDQMGEQDGIRMVYLVVDSDSMYREMAQRFPKRKTCQLYRDYLDNFKINIAR